jgi:hypothetical protein
LSELEANNKKGRFLDWSFLKAGLIFMKFKCWILGLDAINLFLEESPSLNHLLPIA